MFEKVGLRIEEAIIWDCCMHAEFVFSWTLHGVQGQPNVPDAVVKCWLTQHSSSLFKSWLRGMMQHENNLATTASNPGIANVVLGSIGLVLLLWTAFCWIRYSLPAGSSRRWCAISSAILISLMSHGPEDL